MKIILLTISVLVLLFDGFLYTNPDKITTLNYLFNLAYGIIFFLGMYAAFIRSKRFTDKPNLQKSMVFFGLGMFFYGLGLVIWTYYNLVLKIEIPYPSFADIAFLIYYPGVFAGIYFLIKSFGGVLTKKLVIEGSLIFLVFFMIIYFFLNQTSLGPDVSLGARYLNIGYTFFDSILIAMSITILRTEIGISSHPNILYFVFGFIILAVADTIFSYRSAVGSYWNGDMSDFLFAVSGFLTSWGILTIPNVSLNDHSTS
ncbi:MAG TPA: hypothetical protein VKC53_00020 [Patescibacteria group bacterium]|nr:hypothetical protein [Patescibacteria group bacterium]